MTRTEVIERLKRQTAQGKIILGAGAAGFITFCVKRKTPPDVGKNNN